VVRPTLASPKPYAYRNRISVHIQDGRVGFHAARTRKVIDVVNCPIASDEVNKQLAELREHPPRFGQRTLRERARFRGFRQVNDAAADVLLKFVKKFIEEGLTRIPADISASQIGAKAPHEGKAFAEQRITREDAKEEKDAKEEQKNKSIENRKSKIILG